MLLRGSSGTLEHCALTRFLDCSSGPVFGVFESRTDVLHKEDKMQSSLCNLCCYI